MLSFFYPIIGTLLFDGVLLVVLTWMFHSPRFASRRISPKPSMKVSKKARLTNIGWSSLLSLALVFGLTWLFFDSTFHQNPTSVWRIAFEVVAILLVYDFAYYFLHRAMHHKKLMRFVHGVHHRVHNPTALESFYLHPLELFAGLALLYVSTWVVGPVHAHSFAVVFFIHASLNIVVHSGVVFGHWLFAPIDHLTRKHHIHHMNDFDTNYASLTPFPDMFFGTGKI